MKVLKPIYYDEFVCVGGKCKDTCCAGWTIGIDDETYKKYQQITGEFGEKLCKSISYENGAKFILNEDMSCPFLNKDHLCDIYINIGEDKMCNTCKRYPRATKRYYEIIQQDVSLSCPEVARILVSNNKPIEYCLDEYEDDITMTCVDNEVLLNSLITGRGISVGLMHRRDISLWKRIYLCLNIADKLQKHIDKQEYNEMKKSIDLFQNDDYIREYSQALEGFPVNTKLKLIQYKTLIAIISNINIDNKNFYNNFFKYYNETMTFITKFEESEIEQIFEDISQSFDNYYNEKDFTYENYIVYYLFNFYMLAYKNENVYKYMVVMAEGYSLMKLFAMVHWYNNGYQLSDDEQIEILYSYSRVIEHTEKCIDFIYEQIKENGLDGMAYLAVLLR